MTPFGDCLEQTCVGERPAIAQHNWGGTKGSFFGNDAQVAKGSFGRIDVHMNAGGGRPDAEPLVKIY